MTIQQMKDAIVAVYDTTSWKKKVAHMYDDQVIAIYHDFSNRGKLNKVLRRERPGRYTDNSTQEQYQQMTIFDFIK